MKYPLIIAISVIISSPVLAETKIFGSMNSSFQYLSHVNGQSSNTLVLDDALFGIKGTKDIREGMSLIYQLSWGLSKASFDGLNDHGIENRNQAIGLASPSGAVLIGRFDTPFKTVGRKADLFWYSQIGQNRHITNAKNWDVRADKVVVFQSPLVKGVQASAAYAKSLSDTSRLTEDASATSLSVSYKKAHFAAAFAYENHNLKMSLAEREGVRLTLGYQKNNLKLQGVLQKEKNATQYTNQADAGVIGLGIAYHQGGGAYKAQYYVRDEESSNQSDKLFSLGYDYKFSSQVDVYVQASKLDGGATFIGFEEQNNQSSVSPDRAVSLGFKMSF